ncbi:helix-turn-helix transcriptional regulator [Streptomyces phaeochromogenes]|uniref:helix-turn-helix domain-containing protein n=1 Tax=Streptomyces phaeochromogenes TaxID=1923 RepID=UPI0022576CF7|nr:helix-turn-helix transcriptional regulator [Streptomyces phaeochromogenes]MCX5605544.1 helix-turn-helix transcriptional regulator [Streptomyces phaeochromogenes]
MVARTVITVRQERLGAELRKLRERSGLGLREAARATGINESKLSSVEAARVGVSAERIRFLASRYGVGDSPLIDALVIMANERVRGWWEEYRGLLPRSFVDLAELECHATYLRSFEMVHIPGLLQTEEHVQALYNASTWGMAEEQRETRARFRLQRQEVLHRDDLVYEVVIHEAALRIRRAGLEVVQQQLRHILEQSERPQVSLRVVPFDADRFNVLYATLLLGGPVPELDTVLLDAAHEGTFLDAEAQLDRYRRVFVEVQKSALGVVESREFIHRLTKDQ